MDVSVDENGITLDQSSYKESLTEIPNDINADPSRELTKDEYKHFRGAIGKLSWLSAMTCPDLAFDTLDMSCYNKKATVSQARKINKIIRIANCTESFVKFSKIGRFEDLKIIGISDASFNTKDDKTKSVMGKLILLSNLNETKVSPILWKSKTIQTVCKSVKTAETRAFDKTCEDAIYIARCFWEIYKCERTNKQIPVEMITDSKSLVESINSTKQIEEKLIRPIIKWIKQMVDAKALQNIRWCDTDSCISDALTKSGSKVTEKMLKICQIGEMPIMNYQSKKTERKGECQ